MAVASGNEDPIKVQATFRLPLFTLHPHFGETGLPTSPYCAMHAGRVGESKDHL
ncbi:hypothetical protein Hdeb2414_s0243g00845661 [Helianthus debilis subsp. tardiflorus]